MLLFKSFAVKARDSGGARRIFLYVAVTREKEQRSIRAFCKVVKLDKNNFTVLDQTPFSVSREWHGGFIGGNHFVFSNE